MPCKGKALRKADEREVSKMNDRWGVARGSRKIELAYDELMHRSHKYLYKKKVNGKYRYYYDVGKANWKNGNTNIGEDGQETDSNIRGYTKFQDLMGVDEREKRNRAVGRYNNATKTYENQQKMTVDELYRNNISLEKSNSKRIYEGKLASSAIEEFNKTPLGKIEKMSKTIQKAKKWLNNLFKKK